MASRGFTSRHCSADPMQRCRCSQVRNSTPVVFLGSISGQEQTARKFLLCYQRLDQRDRISHYIVKASHVLSWVQIRMLPSGKMSSSDCHFLEGSPAEKALLKLLLMALLCLLIIFFLSTSPVFFQSQLLDLRSLPSQSHFSMCCILMLAFQCFSFVKESL